MHAVYEAIKATMGAPFVPNFFKTQAAVALRVVRSTWAIVKGIGCYGMLGRDKLESAGRRPARARVREFSTRIGC